MIGVTSPECRRGRFLPLLGRGAGGGRKGRGQGCGGRSGPGALVRTDQDKRANNRLQSKVIRQYAVHPKFGDARWASAKNPL